MWSSCFPALAIGVLSCCAATATSQLPTPSSAALLRSVIEVPRIDSIVPSPGGRKIAFRVIRRDLGKNRTWTEWYSMPSDGHKAPSLLGSRQMPLWIPLFDFVEDGSAAWTPDGRSLIVREVTRGQIQVHAIGPEGRDRQLTHDPADVESFRIVPGSGILEYTTRNSRVRIQAAQRAEEQAGVHFDRSVFSEGLPLTHNFRVGGRETTIRTVDASTAEVAFAGDTVTHRVRIAPTGAARANDGSAAETRDLTDPKERSRPLPIEGGEVSAQTNEDNSDFHVVARLAGDKTVTCPAEFCSGDSSTLRQLARGQRAGEVVILYERNYSARTGIFGWTPATGAIRTLVPPTGSIDGGSSYRVAPCPIIRRHLVCTAASPEQPPRLISVDLESGAVRTLYAPYSANAAKALLAGVGQIRFLEWKNVDGRPANGVLFLPRIEMPKLPLVITTPRCRGFLRGGAGNLTPEIALASAGIAALCINNDNGVPLVAADADPAGRHTLAMHRAAIASWATIIGELDHEAIIDPSRVGISGHSYTSMVAAYAISHTDLFAAASLGTGVTIDPTDYYLMAAPANSWRRQAFSAVGLPAPSNDPAGIWPRVSPSLNATHIKAPVLIQPPEVEYLLALQLYGSIQDAGGTADMFIYPGEGHAVERYPSHMFWRMSRSIGWFQRWLSPTAPEYASSAPTPLHRP